MFLCRVPIFPECCTRGRGPLPSADLYRVPGSLLHSGKSLFPECNSSPSATIGEDSLSRVPDFWHSGKPATLEEFCLTRSVCFQRFLSALSFVQMIPHSYSKPSHFTACRVVISAFINVGILKGQTSCLEFVHKHLFCPM